MGRPRGERDHWRIGEHLNPRRQHPAWRGPACRGGRLPPWLEPEGPGSWPRRPAGPPRSGPIRRRREDALLGGVAAGLAARMGIDPTYVRVGFLLFGLAGGWGLAVYVLAWLLVPAEGEQTAIGARALSDLRGMTLAIALVPALVVVLLIASALHAGWLGTFAWPLFLASGGTLLVWRNATGAEREVIHRAVEPLVQLGQSSRRSRRAFALRIGGGIALVLLGLVLLLALHSGTPWRTLLGVGCIVAGFVVVFGPWWLTLARELVEERQARARAEERADMAARVHDSVLQTLALIQKSAGEPHRVVQLARAQEREIRSWLVDGHPSDDADATLAAAVRRVVREVEAAHGVPVEAVIVGDCPLDDDLRALVAAGREAVVNAAKWSGAPVISIYLEIEPSTVSLFVRDRGAGFDPEAIAPDRRGVTESIHGRMARRGGRSVVRSVPGEGTEVELVLGRQGARAEPRKSPV